MKSIRILFHIIKADFLERLRCYRFLITLGLTVFAAYIFVPSADAIHFSLHLGDYRGIYNSAWIGCNVSLLTTIFLTLAGFYVVKDSIARDVHTRVGQIIATTPLTKPLYTLGKAFSNFVILAVMLIVSGFSSIVMFLMRSEVSHLDLWVLLSPILFIALPAVAVVAALAVLFETISWLNGGVGNVVYFFVWVSLLSIPPLVFKNGDSLSSYFIDIFGMSVPLKSISDAAKTSIPEFNSVAFSVGAVKGTLKPFLWEGMNWTAPIIAGRAICLAIATGIALLSSVFFNRFDTSKQTQKFKGKKKNTPTMSQIDILETLQLKEEKKDLKKSIQVHLTPLTRKHLGFNSLQLLFAEIRLLTKELKLWWLLCVTGLIIGAVCNPVDISQKYLLPIVWFLPILVWSSMGCREKRCNTSQMIFSSAHALRYQLPLTLLAGVIFTAVTGSGVGIRLMMAGNWGSVFSWGVGVLFIPTLALTMGIWSGSSKMFEIVYTILWYLGPVSHIEVLDFMGATRGVSIMNITLTYLIVTVSLFILAVIGRMRQIRI